MYKIFVVFLDAFFKFLQVSRMYCKEQLWQFILYISASGVPRGSVMISKLVPLEQLQLSSEVDPHLISTTFGLVPHLNYTWKITISASELLLLWIFLVLIISIIVLDVVRILFINTGWKTKSPHPP